MRLIDADKIKTIDYSGLTFIAPNDYEKIADYFYQQLIKNQPTAYDVEKVVSELKSHNNTEKMATAKLYNGEHRYYRAVSVTKAIKIVKGGGVDED